MSKTFTTETPIAGRVRCCLDLIKGQDLKGKSVLDIGSSFGWLENQLKNTGAKLIGIEPNEKAVEFANKHYGKFAEFKVGNALEIPQKDKSVNFVIFFDVIEHVPGNTEKQALKEIHRTLKKGGYLLLSTPNSHWLTNLFDPAWYLGHRHYEFKKLEKMIEESGFKIESHVVRGGAISVFYMLWFYIMKWIFQVKNPRNTTLEKMEDHAYNSDKGIFTHYLVAKVI